MKTLVTTRKYINNRVTGFQEKVVKGKTFLVVPVTMIVPGVLNGSQGGVLYTPREISKSASLWNKTWITVNHPRLGKSYVSAKTPGIFKTHVVGYLKNVVMNGVLKGEAWIDVAKADKVDKRVCANIRNGRSVEVSTGLYSEMGVASHGSSYKGREYHAVAKNYTPDHLAILLDSIGACSISDGCGLGVNKAVNRLSKQLIANMRDSNVSGFDITLEDDGEVYHLVLMGKTSDSTKGKRMKLSTAKRKAIINKLTSDDGCGCFIEDDVEYLQGLEDKRLFDLSKKHDEHLVDNEDEEEDEDEDIDDDVDAEDEEDTVDMTANTKKGGASTKGGKGGKGGGKCKDDKKTKTKVANKKKEEEPDDEGDEEDLEEEVDEPLANSKRRRMTVDEFRQVAPKEYLDAIDDATELRTKAKAKIINQLVRFVRDDKTKKRLVANYQRMPMEQLRLQLMTLPEAPKNSNVYGAPLSNRMRNGHRADDDSDEVDAMACKPIDFVELSKINNSQR